MKQAPITQLFDYTISDNCIEYKQIKVYLFRWVPPNGNLFTQTEWKSYNKKMERALDSLARSFSIFITDQVQDLRQNKQYWESREVKYFPYTRDITASIESTEVTSASVQKAFYLILATNDLDQMHNMYTTLEGLGFHIHLTEKQEIATLLRNYNIREFISEEIYMLENEINLKFTELAPRRQQKKGARQEFFHNEYIRRLSPLDIRFTPKFAEHNDIFRKTIMIKNFPSNAPGGCMQEIALLPNTSMMIRLAPMSDAQLIHTMNNQIKSIRAKSGKKQMTEQEQAYSEEKRVKEAYARIMDNNNRMYLTNVYITVYGTDRESLESNMKSVTGKLNKFGATHENLKYRQKDAFLCVSPFGEDKFIEWANNIPSTSLAGMFGFSFSTRNDPYGFPIGKTMEGGSMFLDLFRRSKSATNSNFCITGQSGQGKSWLMKKIISMFIFSGTYVFTLDPEDEYSEMFRTLGGSVCNCIEGSNRINPFEIRMLKNYNTAGDSSEEVFSDEPKEVPPDAFQNKVVFLQHLSWLKDFMRVLFPEMKPDTLTALMDLVQVVYHKHGIDENTDISKLASKDYITFSDVYHFVFHLAEQRNAAALQNKPVSDPYFYINTEILNTLVLTLKEVTHGSLSQIFNGHTNVINANLINFSIKDLLMGDNTRTQAALFNIMTFVWNRIAMKEHRIYFGSDELHTFILNPIVAQYFKEFTTRARKYDAVIGMATQNLSALRDKMIEHLVTAIFSNTCFKFLFFPGDEDLVNTKELLQLSEGDMERISSSNAHHCLLKAGNSEKYYVHIGALPYEELLFGKAGGE